jgi:hypothetical protein
MKTIKVTGPHVLFSKTSPFYEDLQELSTRDSTNKIHPRDRHFTLPNGSRIEISVYNKVYKKGDFSVAYLDGESSFSMNDMTGWSNSHLMSNVYGAPVFISLSEDEFNNSTVPNGVSSYQKVTYDDLYDEFGEITGQDPVYANKTWGEWFSGMSNRSTSSLLDDKIGFGLSDGNEYLDGKQIYTIASAGFTVLKQEDFNDAKTEVAPE